MTMANTKIYTPDPLVWSPEPDITTYELALCVPLFTSSGRLHQFHSQLPAEAKRHWKPA